jgi:hypothetical protein
MLKMGYCGDICEICPRYMATQSGDEKQLREAAVLWKIVGWRDEKESFEELTCNGCESLEICELDIRDCVLNKSIENCGQCTEYPCARLLDIFENNEKEASIRKTQFSTKDYQTFHEAFFSKKERLDKIQNEKNASNKRNIS